MTLEPNYVRNPQILWRRTADRLLLLVPGQNECLILGGTALQMWDCFAEPCSIRAAIERMAERFEVDPAVVAADVVALRERLVASRSLVEEQTS